MHDPLRLMEPLTRMVMTPAKGEQPGVRSPAHQAPPRKPSEASAVAARAIS